MAQVPNILGGISYTSPTFNWGDTSQAISGGLSFDLPLASANMFTTQALDFSANNTRNTQNFLQGVINTSQSHVTQVVNRSFDFQTQSLATAERVATGWQDVQRYAIKKASKGGCFITTAICEVLGLPDDCDVLQTLRQFRDEVLLTNEEDAALVQQYYDEAPIIVELLKDLPLYVSVLNKLAQEYIFPAVAAIKFDRPEEARQIYINLFEQAKKLAGG